MIGLKGIPATYGGIERHVEEIGARLVGRGHEVTVYCRLYYTKVRGFHHGMRLLRLASVNTKHLDTASHTALCALDATLRSFDVVHFHALGPSGFSFLPRLRGKRTIVTIHGLDWEREKWGPLASAFLKRCEYPALHFPSRTIVVSETLQRYFEEKYLIRPLVIPNGTALPAPRPLDRLCRFGLEAGRYVLFVGRLVPEKGCHFLLDAFRSVRTGFKLAVAGGSSFSDAYVDALKAQAAMDPRVALLDYVYGEELEELWSNAYCVVLPSTMEGLSIALLEALSFGRCVLVSDIPENLEVVDGCAASFRSRDVADLASKLQGLIDDPGRVASLGERARRRVEERYSWERVADATEAVYRELAPSTAR
jgi:glycosyltransferase involved in cell wall biosynthesis